MKQIEEKLLDLEQVAVLARCSIPCYIFFFRLELQWQTLLLSVSMYIHLHVILWKLYSVRSENYTAYMEPLVHENEWKSLLD